MKVFITRDERNTEPEIWVWLQPKKGNWQPAPMKQMATVNYQRSWCMDEIDTYFCYDLDVFEKIFKLKVKPKTVKSVDLSEKLLMDTSLRKY